MSKRVSNVLSDALREQRRAVMILSSVADVGLGHSLAFLEGRELPIGERRKAERAASELGLQFGQFGFKR